jgi:hypothetical protein
VLNLLQKPWELKNCPQSVLSLLAECPGLVSRSCSVPLCVLGHFSLWQERNLLLARVGKSVAPPV